LSPAVVQWPTFYLQPILVDSGERLKRHSLLWRVPWRWRRLRDMPGWRPDASGRRPGGPSASVRLVPSDRLACGHGAVCL